jgi:uncharacterized protein
MQRIEGLYVAQTENKGRGVFCSVEIQKKSIIEICPIILIPEIEVDTIHETELHDYYFIWGENDEQAAIALGFGSLYNHSYSPNANYIYDFEFNTIEFFAIKKILPGTEITINYHGDPKSNDPLWFDENGKRIERIKYNPKLKKNIIKKPF